MAQGQHGTAAPPPLRYAARWVGLARGRRGAATHVAVVREHALILAVVIGVALGALLLRAAPQRLAAPWQRVAAGLLFALQPLLAYLALGARAAAGVGVAWSLAGLFFTSAPVLFKRAGEDLDRHTDAVAAGTLPPSRLRLVGMALLPLTIIVTGALMLLVVYALVARA